MSPWKKSHFSSWKKKAIFQLKRSERCSARQKWTNWNPKCQSISECFSTGKQYKRRQAWCIHRGKVALLMSTRRGLTQQCLCLFSHYTIVWAWTTVPLFIESDGTMLHLNLFATTSWLCAQLGITIICGLIRTAGDVSQPKYLHFYIFTSFSIQISVPKNKQKWLIWIGSAMQYRGNANVRSEEQCYMLCFIFCCFFLFGWLCCWRWSRPYIFLHVLSAFFFSRVWYGFYAHRKHTHMKNQVMPWDKKENHAVVTPVTSL